MPTKAGLKLTVTRQLNQNSTTKASLALLRTSVQTLNVNKKTPIVSNKSKLRIQRVHPLNFLPFEYICRSDGCSIIPPPTPPWSKY